MICTVTFNPSLDYIVSVGDFRTGRTNRTDSERILPGGKGINVSVVLKNLGIGSRALGFTAGFTGEEIRREVEALGICPDFISVPEGLSRINVKIRNLDGTEINGMGPVIGEDRTEELMEKLDGLGAGDVLVLAGSIPASLPDDMYSRILERLRGREILSLVDAEGDLLKNALRYLPFLIKPNHHELGGPGRGGRERVHGSGAGGKAREFGGSRRFHARRIPCGVAGEAGLRTRLPDGAGSGERQRLFRMPGLRGGDPGAV